MWHSPEIPSNITGMMEPSIKRTVLLVLFLVASPCFGWGRDGHKIASTITTHHLRAEAKAAVAQLLGGQSPADVSTWAGEIRPVPCHL